MAFGGRGRNQIRLFKHTHMQGEGVYSEGEWLFHIVGGRACGVAEALSGANNKGTKSEKD